MSLVIVVLALAALMFLLTSVLVAAHRWLHVVEDPRIDQVEEMLPHANCGACGLPGCRPFAEALVRGEVSPSGCTVGNAAQHRRIATFLGVDVGVSERRVARLACAGGTNVARSRARYRGLGSCGAAALVSGGGKGCFWGCLGLADCAAACDFDAIYMDAHDLPRVIEAACTACGDCVRACPKDLFSLQPVEQPMWVACASRASGDAILEECEVACTACARCAVDAPGQISMEGGLPKLDYSGGSIPRGAIERCPTGAIGWFEKERGFCVGASARRIIRRGGRPDGAT